ncbi:hypothetical protein [Mesorhizobium sp. YR577]|uniref:hypothetical protein n=1 Tax=Mesorhizobium sp. YR577 TaxID=1884373 RepID=UPI0008EB98A2|nr:hypothetical protein [Mesorhizobium sp. YR577]SFU23315.1 hypothetical protein SAMN05518861_15510 [Mesorhizobium sp. YR577]
MIIHGKTVVLDESATFYEDRFKHGMFFPYLSQAVRHAVSIPCARQQQAASIVTQSGVQFGWAEINVLNDYLLQHEER